ncbi:MAG: DNA primase [Clostridia bacterium]|nr:DNA primase [Clostridia bacterium]
MQNHKGYPTEFIDRVRNASNIVDIARGYLPLKQKGQDFWACCPFHSEKTPSFAISAPKQFYYCYGCHESGNVFKLVMRMENLSWHEAVAMLAKKAGLEVPQTEDNAEWLKIRQKRDRLHQALVLARDFYCRNLYLSQNKAALDYLHNRGIDDELIKLFHIGYSDSWQGVVDELKQHGISEQTMHEAGIVAKRDDGKRVWDAQFERITFAIHDVYGNCIGFTGRTMKKDENIAKYKNTAETSVFNKSNIVYGVDVMKNLSRGKHTSGLIVVEGNVDEIAMIKHGFVNTVACMGTALTKFHASVMKRFGEIVYLCLDGDNAGQNATLKSIDTLQDAGLKVKIITLPDGQDPDEFLTANGAEAMQKMIDSSIGGLEFKLEYIKKHSNLNDKVGKTAYLNRVVELLVTVDNEGERELYLQDIADNLGIDKIFVRNTINARIKPEKDNTISSGNKSNNNHNILKNKNFNQDIEAKVIYGFLHNQPYAKFDPGSVIVFKNSLFQKIYDQHLKLNDIDDKLEEKELQEIASLREVKTNLTLVEQEVEWKNCYHDLLVDQWKQKKDEALKKGDLVEVQRLSKLIKLDQTKQDKH